MSRSVLSDGWAQARRSQMAGGMEHGVDYSGCGLWIQWMVMNPASRPRWNLTPRHSQAVSICATVTAQGQSISV